MIGLMFCIILYFVLKVVALAVIVFLIFMGGMYFKHIYVTKKCVVWSKTHYNFISFDTFLEKIDEAISVYVEKDYNNKKFIKALIIDDNELIDVEIFNAVCFCENKYIAFYPIGFIKFYLWQKKFLFDN